MKSKTTVLIADDHPVVLAGVAQYLQGMNFDVLATAENVEDMISALKLFNLDIVVTDFSFGGDGDGLRMIERIRRIRPEIKIVVFSRIRPISVVRQLLAQGADAFVSKTVGLDFVREACQTVLTNPRYVDPSTKRLLQATTVRGVDPEDQLSAREREVLRLLAKGLNIQEIAQRFQRSAKTISAQKCTAMSKLGLRKEIELALYLARLEER